MPGILHSSFCLLHSLQGGFEQAWMGLVPRMYLACTWLAPGLHLPCTWLVPGLRVALGWLWGRIEMALGCLSLGYQHALRWLCCRIEVALGAFVFRFTIIREGFIVINCEKWVGSIRIIRVVSREWREAEVADLDQREPWRSFSLSSRSCSRARWRPRSCSVGEQVGTRATGV